jgi:hypothetical protein
MSSSVQLPGLPSAVDQGVAVAQMIRRASSVGFQAWWSRNESVGFCANPIHLAGADGYGREHRVLTRCNNRRAAVCPSCSDLYARDIWQLVHAGTAGGHHGVPASVASRPQVFVTLTAPSYGAVHSSRGRECRDHRQVGAYVRCPHGKPLWCSATHNNDDERVGQPLCVNCYDYAGHVLFTWYLPELWRRFTITLRRGLGAELRAGGINPDAVRLSFVKVVELQARAIPHIHAVIRLDPATDDSAGNEDWVAPVSVTDLAAAIQRASRRVSLTVDHNDGSVAVGFGTQIDAQPVTSQHMEANHTAVQGDSLSSGPLPGRRVAGYLAKYVTKSLADFGISARRISAEAIAELDVPDHVRAILTAIARMSTGHLSGMAKWLHTLGFRGHITSKSRRYSTTMTALRAHRAAWTREKHANNGAQQHDPNLTVPDADGLVSWVFDGAGHTTLGDRTLICSAALQRIHTRRIGLVEARRQAREELWDPPWGRDD